MMYLKHKAELFCLSLSSFYAFLSQLSSRHPRASACRVVNRLYFYIRFNKSIMPVKYNLRTILRV